MQSQRSESYVKERWNWSRSRAYELIDTAEVDETLSGMPDKKPTSEAQSREVDGNLSTIVDKNEINERQASSS